MIQRSLITLLAAAAILLGGTSSAYADDVAKAAKAYRQAQQAELSEEYALAADLYELADQLAPSGPALRGAMRMALRAERWAGAAGLAVDLRRRYPDDKESRELAAETLNRTRLLVAEVAVDCGAADCTVLVDGKVASFEERNEHTVYLQPGKRSVSGGYARGTSDAVVVSAKAGATESVQLQPPEVGSDAASGQGVPAPIPTQIDSKPSGRDDGPRRKRSGKSRQRLSPWFFGVGAVATVGLAAGTAVSGVQAQRAGDDFREDGYTRDLYNTANRLEIQTNVLFGVTGAVGITTIVFAIFTDWDRGKKKRRAKARPAPGPGTAGVGMAVDF